VDNQVVNVILFLAGVGLLVLWYRRRRARTLNKWK
jgi:hypothetical protein